MDPYRCQHCGAEFTAEVDTDSTSSGVSFCPCCGKDDVVAEVESDDMTFWAESHDGEPEAYRMARRHYSAHKNPRPKIRQFVGPGQKLVLIGMFCHAVFAWRKAAFRADGQTGVECSKFRNESPHRSSDMIKEAMQIAWELWPKERLFTMIDPHKVRSTNPGYCFLMAGWRRCGITKRGLLILECVGPADREAAP